MVVFRWTPEQVDGLGFYDFLVAVDTAQRWLETEGERAAALVRALMGSRM